MINRFFVVVAAFAAFSVQAAKLDKQARKSDVASSYSLEFDGDLFRTIKGTGRRCQITSDVRDFKVSQHPNDVAMIYFIKREAFQDNLYVLHNAERTGDCPKASKKMIMPNVKFQGGEYMYHVVSNTETTVVNMALSDSGEYVAWDNNAPVVRQFGVVDYDLHPSFGVSGAAFSSYVAFAINRTGHVLKVKGKSPAQSKFDTQDTYSSLNDFKGSNRIR